ncbi:hypothetical protein O185_16105 [Photorhabdus temperata J3]|uniref:Uncharacterized protein n=1 Tax=Photorhabdus temperata J3 TaxID=1389415 RepID=U7QW34_PHOTE|nr:hypothetical protein O185_16105 [Photorhabdus temperata J3]
MILIILKISAYYCFTLFIKNNDELTGNYIYKKWMITLE